MPCCLDLEMKWGHVINQANFHKVVRVVARFRAMCHSACNFDPLSRGIGVQN
jgi:hypothetical protein